MTPKTKSIIQLITICILTIVGLVLSFIPFAMPGSVNDYKSLAGSITLGNDLTNGAVGVFKVEPLVAGNYADFDEYVKNTMDSMLSILSSKGCTDAIATSYGNIYNKYIRIEVSTKNSPNDKNNPKNIFDLINNAQEIVISPLSDINAAKADSYSIRGQEIVKIFASQRSTENGDVWVIPIELSASGRERLKEMSTTHETIYIHQGTTADTTGTTTVFEDGRLFLSNDAFTKTDAENQAIMFRAGSFNVQLVLEYNDTISPTLGYGALKGTMIAGIVAFVMAIIFMIVFYKGFGLLAGLALLIEMVLLLFFMATLPFVHLTLPGVAGILLCLALSVDGQIIMFQKIKEEFKAGKKMRLAMNDGYKKSIRPFVDKSIITFIIAIVLFLAGTGSVKAFAAPILVGVVVMLFTQLVMLRWLMAIMMRIVSKKEKFYGLKRLPKKELTGGNTNGK